jgi:hypothetical protein
LGFGVGSLIIYILYIYKFIYNILTYI